MRDALSQMASSGRLYLELEEGKGTLWLDHPERRNAMSAQMMLDLEEVVGELEEWDGGLLLVRGVGGHFCAGADLRLMRGPFANAEGALWMSDWMTGLLERLRMAPFLSVSLLEGAVMGGGAELACSTDLRWIQKGARFQFVQAARGVSPGWGGAGRLRRILGHSRALTLLASSKIVDPHWALQHGLVNAIFSTDNLEQDLADEMAVYEGINPAAIRANKQALLVHEGSAGTSCGERDAFEECLRRGGINLEDRPASGTP